MTYAPPEPEMREELPRPAFIVYSWHICGPIEKHMSLGLEPSWRLLARHIPCNARLVLALSAALLAGCAGQSPMIADGSQRTVDQFIADTSASSVLGPDARYAGSPYPDVGLNGLFPVHGPEGCQIAVLHGGEDSFAVHRPILRASRRSDTGSLH